MSEARQRVLREGRNVVTEADLLAVLNVMGFRGFHEPLKSFLQECAEADRVRCHLLAPPPRPSVRLNSRTPCPYPA